MSNNNGDKPSEKDKLSEKAADLVEARLRALVTLPPANRTDPPAAARLWLDDLLSKHDSYRDATLAIIAFSVSSDERLDVRLAPDVAAGNAEVDQSLR